MFALKLYNLFSFADITEVGRCAKASCEHTARSSPTLSDVVITLVEIGTSVTAWGAQGFVIAEGEHVEQGSEFKKHWEFLKGSEAGC